MKIEDNTDKRKEEFLGIWYAVGAYIAWGILPLYWKALKGIPAAEILAQRILWSFVFVSIFLIVKNRGKNFRSIWKTSFGKWGLLAGALLLSANWFTYIWAVNSDQIVEASLGYYINPLFSIFLGMAVLKEKLNLWQIISLILAFAGVAVITVEYGQVPWISLILAVTFGLYGLVKKLVKMNSMQSLALETAYILPAALLYLVFKELSGTAAWGTAALDVKLLLIFSGIITAMPLLWFAQGAKRIPLSTIGFIQYLAPSISLFLGVIIYKEPFTRVHIISFGLIWSALLLYTFSGTLLIRQYKGKVN